MKKLMLTPLLLVSGLAFAGKTPPLVISQFTASVSSVAGTDTQAAALVGNVGLSALPGAYKAAIAAGAQPNADGTVTVSLEGVPVTVTRDDIVVR